MMNLYWPTYINIENEFNKLLQQIHVDDNQVSVYSSKISELILRCASEIESLSKELYNLHGGTKKGNIHYDYVALNHLEKQWKLSQKVVVISSLNSFLTQKVLKPFELDFQKKDKSFTYSWNHAYQGIKHDRVNNLKQGSIKNLFRISSALFILNIYYKNQIYNLDNDNRGDNFPINLGSTIFSIKFHDGGNGEDFHKKKDFDECIYTSKATDETLSKLKEECNKQRKNMQSLLLTSPKLIEYIASNKGKNSEKKPSLKEIIGKKEHNRIFRESFAGVDILKYSKQLKHEAVLNMNQL